MKIGIIVAMQKEQALILPMLSDVESHSAGSISYEKGRIGDNEVAVMQSGIGKVNAAIGAVSLIDTFRPDVIINTGVAAGAGDNVSVMDLIVADKLVHHDFWCIGEEWGQVPGMPRFFPALVPAIATSRGAKRGLIATGELFISRKAEVDAIRSHFPVVLAIDMESTAIAQACYQRGVPFICFRVISDSPWCSNDNAGDYEEFWNDAPAKSFELVREILLGLDEKMLD